MPTSSLPTIKIRRVLLDRRHPPVSLDDLAEMLRIDLCMGNDNDFRRRLQRALQDALRQGQTGKLH